jgi:hypothetical protein
MSIKNIVSASTALAVTVACIDVPLAEARGGHFTAHVQSVRTVPHTQPHLTVKKVSHVTKHHRSVKVDHVRDGTLKLGKNHLAKLPTHKTLQATAPLKGRLDVPHNLKPKFTLTKLTSQTFQKKMSPFVQKYWKKPYFWLALAGIGYVTVPEFYYDRFIACIDEEDYDRCVSLLSFAALEEEDAAARVHYPMPPAASYRYRASVSPREAAGGADSGVAATATGSVCSFEPFIERKWNTAFVWVQIPETGNVTVPEDYYDRFHGAVAATPPNYKAACGLLVEAAAADMMTMAGAASGQQDGQIN